MKIMKVGKVALSAQHSRYRPGHQPGPGRNRVATVVVIGREQAKVGRCLGEHSPGGSRCPTAWIGGRPGTRWKAQQNSSRRNPGADIWSTNLGIFDAVDFFGRAGQ